jgi:hypothetical protein
VAYRRSTLTVEERTGVVPDIIVSAEAALDTSIVLARKAVAEFAKIRKAALDSVFRIAVSHGLVNEFFFDVLAYEYYSGTDEYILYAISKKKIEYFRQSPSAFESLAYAYYKHGETAPAIPGRISHLFLYITTRSCRTQRAPGIRSEREYCHKVLHDKRLPQHRVVAYFYNQTYLTGC